MLTPTEYSRVAEKSSNVDGVDELVKILLTRDESTFLKFCKALEHNGYSHWSQALQLRGKGTRIGSLARLAIIRTIQRRSRIQLITVVF